MNEPRADHSLLIVINRDGMGHAEPGLQRKLVTNYLTLLDTHDMLPGAIALYGDGVKLAIQGSPVLEPLRSLAQKGVHVILCRTCLDHFGLLDEVAVGVVGGMTDIIAAQWKANKVVAL